MLVSSLMTMGVGNQVRACEQETEGADNPGAGPAMGAVSGSRGTVLSHSTNSSVWERNSLKGGINAEQLSMADDPTPKHINALLGDLELPRGVDVCKAGGKVLLVLGRPILMKSYQGLPATSLDFVPTYVSQSSYSQGDMGYGCQHNYDIKIFDLDDVVTIRNEEGSFIDFTLEGAEYVAEPGYYSKLTKVNGLFKLRKKHGTVYNFDSLNRLESIVDRVGNQVQLSYDPETGKLTEVRDESGRTLTFTYNAQGLIETVTDPAGEITEYVHDTYGRIAQVKCPLNVQYDYYYEDPLDIYKITRVKDPRRNNSIITYDLDNNSVSGITNPEQEDMIYDLNPDLYKMYVTDRRGDSHLYIYHEGKITEHSTVDGSREYGYDGNFNLFWHKDQDRIQHFWSYDDMGNIKTYHRYKGDTETEPWIMNYEPNFNRLTNIEDPLGHNVRHTIASSNGNLMKTTDALEHETNFSYWSTGKLYTVTDANAHTTTFEYDNFGNLNKVTNALQKETIFVSDVMGNCRSVTDANMHITSFDYDALNRLVNKTYPDTTQASFAYDKNDNLETVTCFLNGVSKITTFTYDKNNQLKSVEDPMNYITTFEYDAMGNLSKRIDANGNFIRWEYDTFQRPEVFYDGMGYPTKYTWTDNSWILEDAKNQITTSHCYHAGKVQIITFPDGSSRVLEYDYAGKLTGTKNRKGQGIKYEYTDINQLFKIKYPDTSFVQFTYDDAGNLKTVTDSEGVITYDYDAVNRIEQVSYPGSKNISYSYDDVGNSKR